MISLCTTILNGLAEHHLDAHSPNWSHRLVEAKFALVDTAPGPAEWLILGDSSAAHGLRPDVWAAESPEVVWNLATVAGLGVTGDLWMLERYLARYGPPQGIVWMHTVDVWERAVDPALVGQVPGSSAWPTTSPPWSSWSGSAWRRYGLSRFVPLYAESGSLVSSLFGRPLPEGLRFGMDEVGWVGSRTPDRAQLERDARAFEATLTQPHPAISSDNRAAIAALGARCEAEKIDLYLVHAPVWDAVDDRVDARARQIEAQVKAALHPARLQVLPRPAGVPLEALESTVDHLRPEAAAAFTVSVVQEIRRRRAGAKPGGAASDPGDATPRSPDP